MRHIAAVAALARGVVAVAALALGVGGGAGTGDARAAAGEAPGDFAWVWPLAASDAALQRVVLPAAVYGGVAHPDLRDLRVFNGAHEIVPYAFAPPASIRDTTPRGAPLALFPLRLDAAHPALDDVTLRVRRAAGGTTLELATSGGRADAEARLAGYIADGSAGSSAWAALIVAADGTGAVDVRLRVEAGDDLATWRVVAAAAPLIRIALEGRVLQRDRIEFAPVRARYFRVTRSDGGPMPVLSGIVGETGPAAAMPHVEWRDVQGAPGQESAGVFVYDAGFGLSVTRLDLDLAVANSVAPATVLARVSARDEWRAVTTGVFYRMGERPDALRNPPLRLDGAAYRFWKVVPDARAGLPAAPILRLGWEPAEIVFAARGPGPFELAYGRRDAAAGALPLATLVPGSDTGVAVLRRASAVLPVAAPLAGNRAALTSPVELKRVALWGALLAAAAVLVSFGWRLLRPPPADAGPAASRGPLA